MPKELFTCDLGPYDPYEVFSLRHDKMKVSPRVDRAVISKTNGTYDLEFEDGSIIKDVSKFYETGEQDAISRLISVALRHGANIRFVVEQLMRARGVVVGFSKSIARTLKKYAPDISVKCLDCGSGNMEMSEGCYKCRDCGSSKCS